jgi:RNA polymerase sigma factor (sigma-70 family)
MKPDNFKFFEMKNYKLEPDKCQELEYIAKQISKYPVLAAEEQKKLLYQYHQEKNEAAKDKLILHNLKLVMSIAIKYQRGLLPISDLFQEGIFGLSRAIDKFDFTKNAVLSTYATIWISQTIRRALIDKAAMIRTPVHLHERVMQMKMAIRELTKKFNREPSNEELAEFLDIPVKVVQKRLDEYNGKYNYVGTLDLELGEHGNLLLNSISDSDMDSIKLCTKNIDIEDEISRKNLKKILSKELQKQPERAQLIFKLRFGLDDTEPMTHVEICDYFKIHHKVRITRQAIHQTVKRTLSSLRDIFDEDLDYYV